MIASGDAPVRSKTGGVVGGSVGKVIAPSSSLMQRHCLRRTSSHYARSGLAQQPLKHAGEGRNSQSTAAQREQCDQRFRGPAIVSVSSTANRDSMMPTIGTAGTRYRATSRV